DPDPRSVRGPGQTGGLHQGAVLEPLADEPFHRLLQSRRRGPLALGRANERQVPRHGYLPPAALRTSSGKSSSSCTWRTSMMSPSSIGARRAHSTASSRERTWMVQNPPTISFASANGPSVTRGLPPEKS